MKADTMAIVGGVLLLVGVYVLWRAHRARGNNIDLAYLLVDGELHPPRVTLAKFTGFGAFLVSTYLLIYITLTGHFDATAFIGYLGAWGAVKVASDYITMRSSGTGRVDYVNDR
ncbi:MAG TPA: hypothetical protein PLB41_04345 [Rubrivivax sp.]|jgi:hypothetical protein|nr:hypothetical protein [Rubrivivax sp.]HPP83245.1 hypothetical protein [Rubrivivax sp.]